MYEYLYRFNTYAVLVELATRSSLIATHYSLLATYTYR